jgi:hypothetical protein
MLSVKNNLLAPLFHLQLVRHHTLRAKDKSAVTSDRQGRRLFGNSFRLSSQARFVGTYLDNRST